VLQKHVPVSPPGIIFLRALFCLIPRWPPQFFLWAAVFKERGGGAPRYDERLDDYYYLPHYPGQPPSHYDADKD